MENPTRYHVIQKQKNQVRQYLSESFQAQDGNWANLSAPTGGKSMSSGMQYKHVSLPFSPAISISLLIKSPQILFQNSVGNQNGSKSSCPESIGVASLSLDSKPSSSHRHNHSTPHAGSSSTATTPSGLPAYLQNHRYSALMTASPDAATMSPGLSSVATSTTSGEVEVSHRNKWDIFLLVNIENDAD